MIKKAFILTFMLMFCVTISAFANSAGFNYSRAVNDTSWGLNGDYERPVGVTTLDLEGDLQAGDALIGNLEAGITFDVSAIGVRLHSTNLLKGYDIRSLGRTNDIGADLVVPVFENTDVSVGIFGRNGNPFAPKNALQVLTDAGFDERDFRASLSDITLSEGISIKEGSSVNAAVKAQFDVKRFEIEVKALLELIGIGERVHQAVVDIGTTGELPGGFNWTWQGNVIGQSYAGTLEYEIANTIGIVYDF